MTVPYTSADAQALDMAASLLAGSATFQTLVGANDAAGARAHIIEIDTDVEPVGAHASIDRPVINVERTTPEHWLGQVAITLNITWPPTGGLTRTESFRAALNTAGAIRNEIASAAPNHLTSLQSQAPITRDASDYLAEWFEFEIGMAFRCLP